MKKLVWAIIGLGVLLGIVIAMSPNKSQAPITPLQPKPSTTTVTVTPAPTFYPCGENMCFYGPQGPYSPPTPTTTTVSPTPTTTTTPFPVEEMCRAIKPTPPNCPNATPTPILKPGMTLVSFSVPLDPMWTCDPLIPTYDPRWCYADQRLTHPNEPGIMPGPSPWYPPQSPPRY